MVIFMLIGPFHKSSLGLKYLYQVEIPDIKNTFIRKEVISQL